MKIDWVRKLTSRKFWVALIGAATAIMSAFHVSDMTSGQITSVVSACAVLIAYILGEGMSDAAGAKTGAVLNPESKQEPRLRD